MIAQNQSIERSEQAKLAHYSPELFSSVYHIYPAPQQTRPTKAPKGYKPVFISHYGRHGSRFLTEDARYTWLIEQFESQELTALGKEVLQRIYVAWQQAKGRGGELTSLGEEQHRQIAERMMKNFPSLFKSGTTLHVMSSTSRRCMMSMMAFCERLKEKQPRLNIKRDVCQGYMSIINGQSAEQKMLLKDDTPAHKSYQTYKQKVQNSNNFVKQMFVNPDRVKDTDNLLEQVYWLAQNMQDCGRPTELLSYLTTNELYGVWQQINYRMYLANGDSPLTAGIPALCADTLMNHIVEDADCALAEHRSGATLRFGHDTALLRLLTRLHIKECCPKESDPNNVSLVWQDYNLAPMAANLQIIFYQNKKGHTLVRLMLNENDVHLNLPTTTPPFYDWQEVKKYWL